MYHQERRWLCGAHGLHRKGMGRQGVLKWLLTSGGAQVLGLALGWLFCLFIFFKHFKTNALIYVPPDICINAINKPVFMPLWNDKCHSFSSCYHIHRNIVSHQSLLQMLCKWEQNGFAVFFESQYQKTVLALQIPNLGIPCEECPFCCHFFPVMPQKLLSSWEYRTRRTFQWAGGFWSHLGFSGQASCLGF